MDDDAAVAEEGADALDRGRVEVGVRRLESAGRGRDLAVLAAQVADLAGLGRVGVAGGGLAADEGVQVREGLGAVAVLGDRGDVEVVGWRES